LPRRRLGRLAPGRVGGYLSMMPVSNAKVLTLALAAVLVMATLDAAAARHRRHVSHHTVIRYSSPESTFWSGIPVENGTPVIMKGYHPPKLTTEKEPERRADRPVHIPHGSGAYIPPPVPSPYSSNSPPAAALTRPVVQPYNPPHIETFGDRATNAIHDYPLQKGIGNNPTDQQMFIRQRANQ
jgi:hypothetical protein